MVETRACTAKPIRVAGIGAGYFSQFHYDGWMRNPDAELVAIVDHDMGKADAMAHKHGDIPAFDNFEAMIESAAPDLIDIIAPPTSHYALIDAASSRGLPVICQKPFCTSLNEAEKAVKLVQERGTLIVIHENFRFQPWYREMARWLADGTIGEIHQLTFNLRPGDGQGPHAYLDRQPYFQTMERFLIHETAVHWIDTFRYLLGEPAWVFADLRQLNPAICGEDAGFFIFGFDDGRRAMFDGNRLLDHAAQNRRLTMGECRLEGSKATLHLDGDGSLQLRHFGENNWESIKYTFQGDRFGGDCVYNLQKHVTDHIRHGSKIENEARHYIRNQQIEAAIYQSASRKSIVSLGC